MRDALSLLDQVIAFGGGRALEGEVRALLGTLDRRHVEAILEALAAKDGAALMTCVQQLDERAPDYDQALGELAAALQRMALLQAVPGPAWRGRGTGPGARGAGGSILARGPAALYQIAIMAGAISISHRMRVADSKWRCCACWRSGRRGAVARESAAPPGAMRVAARVLAARALLRRPAQRSAPQRRRRRMPRRQFACLRRCAGRLAVRSSRDGAAGPGESAGSALRARRRERRTS